MRLTASRAIYFRNGQVAVIKDISFIHGKLHLGIPVARENVSYYFRST
jgi:hypothetical protein